MRKATWTEFWLVMVNTSVWGFFVTNQVKFETFGIRSYNVLLAVQFVVSMLGFFAGLFFSLEIVKASRNNRRARRSGRLR
jgi:hypothetical protein